MWSLTGLTTACHYWKNLFTMQPTIKTSKIPWCSNDSKLTFNAQVNTLCKCLMFFKKKSLFMPKGNESQSLPYIYIYILYDPSWNAWAPHAQWNIDKLERHAVRFTIEDFRSSSSIIRMLITLNWNSLNYQGIMFRLLLMYKILHNIVDLKLPDYSIKELLGDITIDWPYLPWELNSTGIFSIPLPSKSGTP